MTLGWSLSCLFVFSVMVVRPSVVGLLSMKGLGCSPTLSVVVTVHLGVPLVVLILILLLC